MPRLPPLNALKAFEAAARHDGFIAASKELNVSRGAISRHIKILETDLGVQLFVRHAQGVRLTEAGQQFYPILTKAFAQIADGASRLAQSSSQLRIICPPATSIRWLLPRLDGLRSLHPEIEIRLSTDFYAGSGFEPAETDIGFSVENWPGRQKNLKSLTLFPSRLTPVCTPAYLDRKRLSTPQELAGCELLHETRQRHDWTSWGAVFAPDHIDPQSGQVFPNFDMAIKAAVMGVGVAMGDLVLCREELETGALVTPFPDMICGSPLGGVCLLGGQDSWNLPKVEAFKAWAFESAQADRDAADNWTAPAKY